MSLHDGFNFWMGKTFAELAAVGIGVGAVIFAYIAFAVVEFVSRPNRRRRP